MNLDLARQLASQLTDALKPNVVVQPGDTLQTILNLARPGDTIELAPGRHVCGELHLPNNITLTGQALPDRNIRPDDPLPILAHGGAGKTIDGTKLLNTTITGIDFESRQDGQGEVIALQDAEYVILDRIRLVGGVNGQKRGIRGNGQAIVLKQSYIANCWAAGQDSQAFCAWDGGGPYLLAANFLEAASENVMFGGADSQSALRIPADIRIEDNFFSKRLEWKPPAGSKTSGKVVKNLLELKAAKRVVIRNNTFERSWTDAQTGYVVSLKSVNQNGTAPWSATEDVLFEGNTIRDVENGINIQGFAADQPGGRTTGIVIRGNDVTTTGIAVQITGGPGAITIDRTTFVNGYTFLQLAGNQIENLTVTNVLANHNAYGVKGDGTGIGLPSLTKFATALTWANNVLLGGAGKPYPPTTYFDLASVPVGVAVGK
jgi:hypothetical protein